MLIICGVQMKAKNFDVNIVIPISHFWLRPPFGHVI